VMPVAGERTRSDRGTPELRTFRDIGGGAATVLSKGESSA